jgi:hypothetical protein
LSERIDISANGTPIKTIFNRPFFSVDLIIFPEAKLQFNVPTVKINYLTTFKSTVSHNTSSYKHNISSYKPSSNIQAENISTYIYCDTVIDSNKNESTYIVNLESNFFTTFLLSTFSADLLPSSLEEIKKNKDKYFKDGRNFIRSLIALTTFSQIKNSTITSITTETILQFFKEFILTVIDTLAHFTTN